MVRIIFIVLNQLSLTSCHSLRCNFL